MDGPAAAEPRTPAAIIDAILRGDRTAETELVANYRRGIVLMLRRRVDPLLAEDVAHDVLAEALVILRTRRLDEPEKLAAFIHGIASNFVRNIARKRARQRTEADTDAVEAFEDESNDPAAIHSRGSLAAAVHRLLDSLPIERDRQVLVRYYFDEADKPEICRELGLSEEHFDRVIHRARRRLRQLLDGKVRGLDIGDLMLLLLVLFSMRGTA